MIMLMGLFIPTSPLVHNHVQHSARAGATATARAEVLTGQERQEGRTTTPKRRLPYQRG